MGEDLPLTALDGEDVVRVRADLLARDERDPARARTDLQREKLLPFHEVRKAARERDGNEEREEETHGGVVDGVQFQAGGVVALEMGRVEVDSVNRALRTTAVVDRP